MEILQRFQESLPTLLKNQEGEMDHYFGTFFRASRNVANRTRDFSP